MHLRGLQTSPRISFHSPAEEANAFLTSQGVWPSMRSHPKLLSSGLRHEPGDSVLCGRAAVFDPLLAWERIWMHWTLCRNEVFLDQPEGLLGIAPSQGGFSDVNQNHPSSSSNNLVYFTSFCTLTFNTVTFLGPKAAVVPLLTNPWSSFYRWGILEEEQIILLPPGVFLIWKNFKYQFWSSSAGLAL